MGAASKISRIYEINTRVWLRELSQKYHRDITLASIPDDDLACLKECGFDAVWLMGVWLASGRSHQVVLQHQGLMDTFRSILSDFTLYDVSGSPYAVAGYDVDPVLGGNAALAEIRKRLHHLGIKLILDFVPNHTALDHPWVQASPDLFIQGSAEDHALHPEMFFLHDDARTVLAHGKDPYFPSWTDVAQLNYFNPRTRAVMTGELRKLAAMCDGLRCDMAMLILNRIQKQIWGERVFGSLPFAEPAAEFWPEAAAQVKDVNPDFILIAEVYWGLDAELAGLGFDYVYDKTLYDILRSGPAADLRAHLAAQGPLAHRQLRFIENHDEDRAAKALGEERSKAAALIMALVPGVSLFYQGQLKGYQVKLPVQLLRRPYEDTHSPLQEFYYRLLPQMKGLPGPWDMLEFLPAWDGNHTHEHFIGFAGPRHLAVVNFSGFQAQGYVHPRITTAAAPNILFKDLLSPAEYVRASKDIFSRGLYLDLPAYGFHLFRVAEVH